MAKKGSSDSPVYDIEKENLEIPTSDTPELPPAVVPSPASATSLPPPVPESPAPELLFKYKLLAFAEFVTDQVVSNKEPVIRVAETSIGFKFIVCRESICALRV